MACVYRPCQGYRGEKGLRKGVWRKGIEEGSMMIRVRGHLQNSRYICLVRNRLVNNHQEQGYERM